MVLVPDNAPYYHVREIGSMASLNKEQIVNEMEKHGVDYVDLPLTTDQRLQLVDVQDRGNCVRVSFDRNKQIKRSSKSHP